MKTILDIEISEFESAIVAESDKSWFIDLRTGLGESEYPKSSFTLEEAIHDQIDFKVGE